MTRANPSFRNKFILSLSLIITSMVYALWQNTNSSTSSLPATSSPLTSQSQAYQEAYAELQKTIAQLTATSTTPPSSKPKTTPVPQTPPPTTTPAQNKPSGLYADGSYVGDVVNAYYGTVQIKAIISGGKITGVQFLQHPDTQSNSRFINDQAMPLLIQEAIQAQSAQVDGVSGATFTSEAFKQSLASALTSAKI